MKKIIVILIGMFIAQNAIALVALDRIQSGGEDLNKKKPSVKDYSQAEYILEPIECTLLEVCSGLNEGEFHCSDKDDMMYELKRLPPEFEKKYRSQFTSGRAKLTASKLYRSEYKLIFTKDTIWSLSKIDGVVKSPIYNPEVP